MKGKGLVWRAVKESPQSVLVDHEGPELKSGERYYWQVRVKDNHGNTSAWSDPQYWQMGLKASDWRAKWISVTGRDTASASPLFRKTYDLPKTVMQATAYITARGLYEAYINGSRVGDAYFTQAGLVSYKDRL